MQFNLADLFESLVDVIPERDAAVSNDRRLTYAQLEARSNRLASFLRSEGVGPGDHVGLYLYNGIEFVEAMVAILKIRAVPINVNYRYVEDELRYLFDNADLAVVIHQREFTPRIASIKARVPTLRLCLAVNDDSGADLSTIGATEYESALARGHEHRDFGPRSGSDQYIIYTGGTTGMPRGVIWRHEDMFFAGLQGGNPGGMPLERPEELPELVLNGGPMHMMPAAPFIHGAAQWAAWISMFTGGKVVLAPGRSFDPRRVWELIEREGVTTMTIVGDAMARPLGEALSAPGASYDTSSLMVIASAGAVLSESVKKHLETWLPNTMILNNFGATETGHQGSAFATDEPNAPVRPSFFMGETSTVLDDDLKPVVPGSGVVGRLARKGRIPLGYYKDPEKTAATFLEIDGERYVVPGDLATIEESGMITVFGRGAACINSGGEKIFCEEVEEALKAHSAVLDAVVVGLPDERWGEKVAALIQLRPGQIAGLEELDRHCRQYIAGYKVPREVFAIDLIVRHPSGKPDFRWAKATALELYTRAGG